ncbi:MAG TPA: hypothetical protein VID73_07270, partial [Ktedonobacterales bacterium]
MSSAQEERQGQHITSLSARLMALARTAAPGLRRTGARATALASWSVIPLLAGMLGSLAAVIVMGALRLLWGAPTLPELVGERLLPLMTADQFVSLLLRFAPNSKTTPLFYALLGQLAVGVLIGPAWALIARPPATSVGRWPARRAWLAAGAFALGMELLTLLLFWPVLFGNLVGYPINSALLLNSLAALIVFAVFMAVVALSDHWLRTAPLAALLSGAGESDA